MNMKYKDLCNLARIKIMGFDDPYAWDWRPASDMYLKDISSLINSICIQLNVLFKEQKFTEAYEQVCWTISFINSINNDGFFWTHHIHFKLL